MGIRVSTSYGVDAGEGFTAVVRAVRSTRGSVFTTVCEGRGPADDARVRSAAAELALAGSQRTAVTAAAMPARESVVRRIDVPLPSIARARRVLPSLLDVQLPFRLEDCASAYPDLRRLPGGRVRALAVAAPREAVARRLDALREAGFDPMILDAEAPALWDRALAEHRPAGDNVRVVAHAAPDRLVLAVGRGTELETVITLREPLRAPVQEDGAGAWSAALQRARQALGRGDAAEWIWTGPLAKESGDVLDAFERDLSAGPGVTWIRSDSPGTFLARALAARAIDGTAADCNLRTGEHEHAGLSAWGASSGRRAAILCIVAGLALAVFQIALVAWIDDRGAAVQTRLEQEASRIGRLSRVQRGQEVRMAKEAVQKRMAALAPVTRMFQPSVTPRLAGILRVAAASGVTIEVVELSDAAVKVEGTSPNRDACSRIDDFLRLQGYKTQVRRREAGEDGRVPFAVQGDRS